MNHSEPTPSKATPVELVITESEHAAMQKMVRKIIDAEPVNGTHWTRTDVLRLQVAANKVRIMLERVERRSL